jgi:hypothetical protein
VLHDWIEEVRGSLGIDAHPDVDRLLDVARVVAHKVDRRAAPLTAYLMGVAQGARGGDAGSAEDIASEVMTLARSWRGPSPDEA